MEVRDRVDGVVIGLLQGFDKGAPLVAFPGNPRDHAIPARSLATLGPDDTGAELALMFEDGRRDQPLILGKLVAPAPPDSAQVIRDGETVRVEADERIELRVGRASIILERDGHITIRGTHVTSQASGPNRIRGGSISLN